VFENTDLNPLFGEFSVRVKGQTRGTLAVSLSPGETQPVRVPVALTDLTGNLQAEIVWTPEQDTGMTPLQSALVWLMIE